MTKLPPLTPTQHAVADLMIQRSAFRAKRPEASAMALEEARWVLLCESIRCGESIEDALWVHEEGCNIIANDIIDEILAEERGSR